MPVVTHIMSIIIISSSNTQTHALQHTWIEMRKPTRFSIQRYANPRTSAYVDRDTHGGYPGGGWVGGWVGGGLIMFGIRCKQKNTKDVATPRGLRTWHSIKKWMPCKTSPKDPRTKALSPSFESTIWQCGWRSSLGARTAPEFLAALAEIWWRWNKQLVCPRQMNCIKQTSAHVKSRCKSIYKGFHLIQLVFAKSLQWIPAPRKANRGP